MAESRSEHPVARAILKKASEMGIAYEDSSRFEYTPGKGVSAICESDEVIVGNENFLVERGISLPRGNGHGVDAEVFVARKGKFLGTLVVADRVRPEAKEAIHSLKSLGLRTVLLTGDARAVADDVGKKLGVDEVASELLPEQKLQYVKQLAEASHTVAMVGDGVNDAPALAQATVGVAMGSGTDVAQESADVVLIGSDLSKLVETLRVARRCRRTIMQNFVGTLVVDSIGVGMAAFGLLNPLLAAFIHVSSELVFILNSARLVPSATLAGAYSGGPQAIAGATHTHPVHAARHAE
jgi:Cd2+/Zn2+-exporting ATPase/Cu+-exporting ATPase